VKEEFVLGIGSIFEKMFERNFCVFESVMGDENDVDSRDGCCMNLSGDIRFMLNDAESGEFLGFEKDLAFFTGKLPKGVNAGESTAVNIVKGNDASRSELGKKIEHIESDLIIGMITVDKKKVNREINE